MFSHSNVCEGVAKEENPWATDSCSDVAFQLLLFFSLSLCFFQYHKLLHALCASQLKYPQQLLHLSSHECQLCPCYPALCRTSVPGSRAPQAMQPPSLPRAGGNERTYRPDCCRSTQMLCEIQWKTKVLCVCWFWLVQVQLHSPS